MESNKYTGMSYFNLLKFPNPTSFPAHMGYIVFQGLGCCFKTDIFRLVDNRREGACSIPHAWINCSHWDRTKATQLTPFILPMVTPSSSMSRKALEAQLAFGLHVHKLFHGLLKYKTRDSSTWWKQGMVMDHMVQCYEQHLNVVEAMKLSFIVSKQKIHTKE